ncbi:hypothetical protein Aple_091530 [Acrocarpospora pleiomorpha]|uniref:Uncharacterized protein n=1 Tax=Acrocarpospora pleiomorpha TaxID=90975 RepID=A0A5M3XYP9_9ACTN|nr:hypothetical protein [Acrocarpospora pleiomorpha]GES26254.1 hypothetical protein Aple_091530 [Acrocarpospora pleiomorpha]
MQLPDETTRAFDSEAVGLADGSARTGASSLGSALAPAEAPVSEGFGSVLGLGAVGFVLAAGELGSAPADVGSPAFD